MPTINVVYWNVQNYGATPAYKSSYGPLVNFIAQTVDLLQADVLFIQELRQAAITTNELRRLMEALWALPAPRNNWHFEWIKGSIDTNGATAVAPFATSNDLDWDAAHHEGYAVFWNQNIAKFRVNAAPPIMPPGGGGPVANTQSETVRTRGDVGFGMPPVVVPIWGIAVPAGGLVAPADPAYRLPAGTTAPPGAGINNAGGGPVVPAGGVLGAAANVNSGTVLPQGTQVGAGGVQLTAMNSGRVPVVVPGSYTLTEPLTLPAPGTVLLPEHALSLVLTGRDTTGGGLGPAAFNGDISMATANFNPGGPNNWRYLYFTRGAGWPASMRGCRRPAYITIDVNRAGAPAAAQRLIPLITYHAPSAAPASSSGMQRAAYSRPLYQVYDPGAGAWIDNARAVLGGDMNVALDAVAYAYNAFTNGFGAGGAACQIRVASPAPPPPPPSTRADNPLNKTTAQIRNPPVGGAPIVNAATNAYRMLAIDNVFYRGFAPADAPAPAPAEVFDLLPAVATAGGAFNLPAAPIMSYANLPVFDQHWNIAWGLSPPPGPATPNIQNIVNFVFDLAAGAFAGGGGPGNPPARRAAEFVHLCVSDHLPVVFTMNL